MPAQDFLAGLVGGDSLPGSPASFDQDSVGDGDVFAKLPRPRASLFVADVGSLVHVACDDKPRLRFGRGRHGAVCERSALASHMREGKARKKARAASAAVGHAVGSL